MAKKKLAGKKTQPAQTDRTVQIVAVVVIALVAIFFLVRYVPWSSFGASSETATESAASSGPKTYDAPPPMTIDTAKKYFATVEMEKGGEFVIELYADKAPITVNSFVFLAQEGYFNGVTFHRVLDGFMAQGGDPTGTGMGGPGYQFVNENSDLTFDKDGVVAMANAGPDTNGSQFFITYGPQEFLNGGYTIFGQVIEGMDVVNEITRRDPEQNPNFTGDVMKSVTITEE
ncbi:peptidylprolyl isomerase [Candidatus Villigracilis vicinus]|uniref:peptidylprolyl isomerase n=1 Tax=Candidatus Villigracilis vicinus TaxID=3140679 RepID=UPI0031E7A3C6